MPYKEVTENITPPKELKPQERIQIVVDYILNGYDTKHFHISSGDIINNILYGHLTEEQENDIELLQQKTDLVGLQIKTVAQLFITNNELPDYFKTQQLVTAFDPTGFIKNVSRVLQRYTKLSEEHAFIRALDIVQSLTDDKVAQMHSILTDWDSPHGKALESKTGLNGDTIRAAVAYIETQDRAEKISDKIKDMANKLHDSDSSNN